MASGDSVSIETTRAAIQIAEKKVLLLMCAREDAVNAIEAIQEPLDALYAKSESVDWGSASASAMHDAVSRASAYIQKQGGDECFEFGEAAGLVDDIATLFERLVREAPVPA